MPFTRISIQYLSKFLLVIYVLWLPALAKYTPYIPNSFFFSYDPPDVAVPIPVTEQCQTITITWDRGDATGPSPVAPYFLHIYTSAFIVPFLISAGSGLSFQWQVPFAPGTLYQICMSDSVGNSGGCQAIYSVIPPRTNNASTTCTNVTFPGVLDISSIVSNGPLSQYGWIDQCTDISVTPQNGTPPYVFTIVPSLHPPYNITSNTRTAMNWTVALSWAAPFFISVSDSAGNSWANGPLHSGMGTNSDCLAGSPRQISRQETLATSIGSAFGGIFLGGVVTCLFMLCRLKPKRSPNEKNPPTINSQPGPVDLQTPSLYSSPAIGASTVPSSGPPYQPTSTINTLNDSRSRQPQGVSDLAFQSSPVDQHSHASSSYATSTIAQNLIQQAPTFVMSPEGAQVPFTVYSSAGVVMEELPPSYEVRKT